MGVLPQNMQNVAQIDKVQALDAVEFGFMNKMQDCNWL